MYNIQKAASRLPFAPKLKEIQVADIKNGLGVFTPQPDKAVSFIDLRSALKKAGYALDAAEIAVAGKLERDGQAWRLVASPSGQRFALDGLCQRRGTVKSSARFLSALRRKIKFFPKA